MIQVGSEVEIINVCKEDSYFYKRDKLIGKTCIITDIIHQRTDGTWGVHIKGLKGITCFYKVMLAEKGANMGTILATFDSKSKPGKEYHVIRPLSGGDPYCDCWQWKRRRDCSHLRAYRNSLGDPNGLPHNPPRVYNNFDDEIESAVKNIINKS